MRWDCFTKQARPKSSTSYTLSSITRVSEKVYDHESADWDHILLFVMKLLWEAQDFILTISTIMCQKDFRLLKGRFGS